MSTTTETKTCPNCNTLVWDIATIDQRLNKCWTCGIRFMDDIGEDDDDNAPTPTQPAHSPLPWDVGVVGEDILRIRTDFPERLEVCDIRRSHNPYAEANAHFIVRAVNNHERLVAALTTVNTWLVAPITDEYTLEEMRVTVRAALADVQEEKKFQS